VACLLRKETGSEFPMYFSCNLTIAKTGDYGNYTKSLPLAEAHPLKIPDKLSQVGNRFAIFWAKRLLFASAQIDYFELHSIYCKHDVNAINLITSAP